MKMKLSQTCRQLLFGIIIFSAIFMIVGGIVSSKVFGNWLQLVFGVLLGEIIAIVLAVHMDLSIANAISLDSDGAVKYTRSRSAIRYLIMIVAIVIALTFPKVFNIIGVLLGIMALKLAAYAQPLTSKYIFK